MTNYRLMPAIWKQEVQKLMAVTTRRKSDVNLHSLTPPPLRRNILSYPTTVPNRAHPKAC